MGPIASSQVTKPAAIRTVAGACTKAFSTGSHTGRDGIAHRRFGLEAALRTSAAARNPSIADVFAFLPNSPASHARRQLSTDDSDKKSSMVDGFSIAL